MVNTYIWVAVAMIAIISFLAIASYSGLIDLSSTDTGTYDEYNNEYKWIDDEVDKAFDEASKEVDEAYKGLRYVEVNETVEEEKPTIFNLICDSMYLYNMTNTTLGNISCFKPEKFNFTSTSYDCICYY